MSTTFKEIARSEIDRIFLNLDEFAELITLDGQEISAVVEKGNVTFSSMADSRDYVDYDSVTIYCKKEYIDTGKYYSGRDVIFNNQRWKTYTCDGEDLVTLVLYREVV